MKRIKSVLVLALTLVMVLSCGQMVGTIEVQAASLAVTVYNAQYVPNSSLPAEVQEALPELANEVKVYIVNDATVIDVNVNSSSVIALYWQANVDTNSSTGEATNVYEEYLEKSQRINVGQELKNGPNGSCNEAVVVYGEFGPNLDGEYIFISQKLAKQQGLSVQGTRTDNANCTMHRLYNPNSGEHFYTANDVEKNHLVSLGWKYEGTGWTAPACSGTPVYRVYNPNAGDHHYTTNVNEKNNLVSLGWNDEGIGWYSNELGTTTLHRLYNPNATGAGAHHYTTNSAEATNLQNLGWRYEGTAWYGL